MLVELLLLNFKEYEMKHNQTCIVCFDGKIVRGIYGKVLSSTQYKFTVAFTYFGEYQVQTFRKERNSRKKTTFTDFIAAVKGNKRFTKGQNSGAFVVIPMNQLKSWYKDYVEIIENNTVEHLNKEVWE